MWVELPLPAQCQALAVQGRTWMVTVSSTMAWTLTSLLSSSHRSRRSWAMRPGVPVEWTMMPLGVMVLPFV